MNKKFTVVLTCWDYCYHKPYMDRFVNLYDSFDKAMKAVEKSVEDDLINFRADYDNEDCDCIVRFWDGEDYQNVKAYKVLEITRHHKYNEKLKETYGKNITVFIEPYIEDDLSIWYKVVGEIAGDIDSFDKVEEAYKFADNYLRGLE